MHTHKYIHFFSLTYLPQTLWDIKIYILIYKFIPFFMGSFPGGTSGKEPAC